MSAVVERPIVRGNAARGSDSSACAGGYDHGAAARRRTKASSLPPIAERCRDPAHPAEHLVEELRREQAELTERFECLLVGYRELLFWSASVVARHLADDVLDRLLVRALSDAPLEPLPKAVAEDLAPLIARSRQLAVRAGLREGM